MDKIKKNAQTIDIAYLFDTRVREEENKKIANYEVRIKMTLSEN